MLSWEPAPQTRSSSSDTDTSSWPYSTTQTVLEASVRQKQNLVWRSFWKLMQRGGSSATRTVGDSTTCRGEELKQDWPVDSTVYLEDMTWDKDEGVYSYCCRCGGGFSVSEEEVEEETQRRQHDDEEEETVEGQHRGVVVCCDTCSLSVYVTWSRHQQTPTLKCL
ncbi:dnaJ homolog subfamily C member 24 isoform X2 [Seriola lalandi dorsalis]|uniref:dnaJ homolog subfamily C member 24 isoform X2 n=1 Tax=Seriola lalandi dorsalis TaxID=1841481 RepID=UPI000C6FBB80|nr:dnaJ homolog subfamily C member 24 isoform X2 [Seriola lalandi dorsalis]XP_023253086.1 dnaJ homolog subfamily C member 24 isoform X2 [Seriola lalandi dorsalis]